MLTSKAEEIGNSHRSEYTNPFHTEVWLFLFIDFWGVQRVDALVSSLLLALVSYSEFSCSHKLGWLWKKAWQETRFQITLWIFALVGNCVFNSKEQILSRYKKIVKNGILRTFLSELIFVHPSILQVKNITYIANDMYIYIYKTYILLWR